MIFWVYSRFGFQKDCIGDVVEAVHKDELNGEDSLSLTLTEDRLDKGDRVVWKDRLGDWHEHIVSERTVSHQDGLLYEFYCENSVAETMLAHVAEIVLEDVKAKAALQRALSGTKWQVGTVDDFGIANFYHFNDSVHAAIAKVVEKWGGEVSTTIEVSADGVSARKLNLESMRGADYGKVFTYGHDMTAVQQTVSSDDVITRLHCYGKATGYTDSEAGYTERLTFESINDGKDYVEDNDAKWQYGITDASGAIVHAEGTVVFESCEDEEELLALGREELAKRNHPHVSYSASVAVLSDYGYDYEDARTGDTVWMRDKPLDLRLQGRVTSVTRYLVNTGATVVEMGDTVKSITDVVSQQASDLAWMRARAETWNDAATSNESWLNQFISNLNAQFDAAGGFVNIDPETGITVYDSPANPTMAMQINGMGFRIANSKDSLGEWHWRTFGTGAGFAADQIVTGKLTCGTNEIDLVNGTVTLKDGLIQDSSGDNYWNLATGSFVTTHGKIGGFDIGQSAIYSGLTSLSANLAGVYVGIDGLAASGGGTNNLDRLKMSMEAGELKGYKGGTLIGSINPSFYFNNSVIGTYEGILLDSAAVGISGKLFVKNSSGTYVDGDDKSYDRYFVMPSSWTAWRDFDSSSSTPLTLKMTEYAETFNKGVLTSTTTIDSYATHSFYSSEQVDTKLSGKANASHSHSEYASTSHTHSISDVSGLQTSLNGKASTSHTHSGYASSSHTHAYSELTGKPSIPTFSRSGSVLTITT